MQFTRNLALLALTSIASAYTPALTLGSDAQAARSLAKLTLAVGDGSLKKELATQNVSQTCSLSNLAVRREYSTLSNTEKLQYTDAVLCLMNKPSKTPIEAAPGVRSRYDDFVALHINQTVYIHFTGSFLTWHRYFIHTFEQALRNECGYPGHLPYWNWGKSALDPANSPYMDGSRYSQGGNGVYAAHNCTPALISGLNCIPPAGGGGCVETGPYAGYAANLSSSAPTLRAEGVAAGTTWLGYQPRCIRRDISAWVTSRWSTDDNSVDLLANGTYQSGPGLAAGIAPFQDHLQGGTAEDFAAGYFGLHSAGHFAFGGDPGGDVFNSPNDPLFWLHHGQIDRTWWIWQNQDVVGRAFLVAGTRTLLDVPPSANTTIEDVLDMGFVGVENSAIKNHVSTVGGQYCYIYL